MKFQSYFVICESWMHLNSVALLQDDEEEKGKGKELMETKRGGIRNKQGWDGRPPSQRQSKASR